MIVAINYANKKYKKQQRVNTKTAYLFGVDKVYSFSPKDIDVDFWDRNQNILSHPRGNGLWLWKPYFILKTLKEMNEGDYIFYVDSGVVYNKNIKGLIKKLEVSGQDIMLFELPLLEINWTKREVFDFLHINDADFLYSNQIMGAVMCFKKTNASISFVERWLDICKIKEMLSPPDQDAMKYQFKNFIAHREDQSLLSVIAKLYRIKTFNDPTDYGKFPLQYLAKKRLFYLNKFDVNNFIDKTYFLLVRKSNPYVYLTKFIIKNLLNRFGLY